MNAILAGIAVKSVALLSVAWLVAWCIGKSSAAARNLLWTVAFAALLALPMLSVSLPSLHFAPADKMLAPMVTFTADAIPAGDDAGVPGRAMASAPAKTRRDAGNILAILWAIGAALGCVRLLLGWAAVERLRSRSKLVTCSEMADLARELALYKNVELREISAGAMPMTGGWLRPAIFLPADAWSWSAEKRRTVLLHELAHVRRGDVARQMLARLALSCYWWNPLLWSGWREFLKMRERAADDLVLDAGARASEYASYLLEVACSTMAPASAGAIAMAQASQIETRLAAILDSRAPRKTPGRMAVTLGAMAAAAMVLPLAAIHAQNASLPADADTTIRAAVSQNNFEMLDRAADGFVKSRQYEPAQKLLEASLQVRANVAGKSSETYSDGLVKLGDLAWEHGSGRSASGYYTEAGALGDRPGTAQALLRLGVFNFRNAPVAEGYLQRSINSGAKGNVYGQALAWMAEIRNAQGNAAEAEALFSRAQAAVKEGSEDEALVQEMYAAFLTSHHRGDEAEAMTGRAAKFRASHVASLAPAAGDGAEARKIGGNVVSPSVIKKFDPEYSQEARVLKMQGTVVLNMVIGTDGKAGNVTLKRSVGLGLDEKALAAISRWTFNPGTEGGAPVPVQATIEVNFRLL
jgi:TonB family protein